MAFTSNVLIRNQRNGWSQIIINQNSPRKISSISLSSKNNRDRKFSVQQISY